jgi:pimeloyl-ACP methyl ester carboxylesterase
VAKAFSLDYAAGRDYLSWLNPPGAALGSPLSLLFFGAGEGWPPAAAPESLRQLRRCPVPTLLVSGDLDVSTPAPIARDEALPFLDHGTEVVVPHASHIDDLWNLQPDAMQHLVTTFFDTGAVEARFDTHLPQLSLPVRLPVLAKAAATTVGAAVLAIAATGVRRLRH